MADDPGEANEPGQTGGNAAVGAGEQQRESEPEPTSAQASEPDSERPAASDPGGADASVREVSTDGESAGEESVDAGDGDTEQLTDEDAGDGDTEQLTDEDAGEPRVTTPEPPDGVPEDVRTYDRFTKVDRATYERVNDFLRDRTYITAREWAIARLCADFRTGTGVEMTKIGENLPYLVPFMTDTYSPQAVNQARAAFEEKVRMSGATFLYGAMSGFFTADELDDLMYEVTEVAKFLLEVEGIELSVEEELETEDRISDVMREVRAASEDLRRDGVCCPECGHEFDVEE